MPVNGNATQPSVLTDKNFTFTDVAYSFSQKENIERLYLKLRGFSQRDSKMTISDFCKRHKIHPEIPGLLVKLGYYDKSGNKLFKGEFKKADAILISVKLREIRSNKRK